MAWVQSVVAYALFMRAVAEEKHAAAVKLQARARVRSSKREVDEKRRQRQEATEQANAATQLQVWYMRSGARTRSARAQGR